ncbi:hypothetical protein ABPG77_002552 [Micractinium sp. CCAP 211/92]
MDGPLDSNDGVPELAVAELVEGAYASEDTLHSSVAFLRNTLTGLGFCQDLNLMSLQPSDVVSTCNTIYGLLLQHQKDCRFREQLKQDMHRLRLDVTAADKERSRLEGRLAAREREIGALTNKSKAASEQHKEELKAAKKDADELQKKVTGCERRIVQLQHEMKRKEKEFERLQERLSHYLSDKRKNDKAVLEMAGKLTQQLAAGGGAGARASAAARSDEGLKAVVAAYETKQTELGKENRDLKAALASLQAEYKEALNQQVRLQQTDASSSSAAAASAADEAFLQSVPSMSEEELRAELTSRVKALQRRTAGLPSLSALEADFSAPGEQRLFRDLQAMQAVVRDQGRLLMAVLSALRASHKAKEAQHQADMRRLAQQYQAQLAAAEQEIQRAKETQAEAAQGEVDALRAQLQEVKDVVQQRAQAEAAAARAEAEAAAAQQREALERQLAAAQAAAAESLQRASAAEAAAAEASQAADAATADGQQRAGAAEAAAAQAQQAAEAANAELAARHAELTAQQEAAAAAQLRFELLKKNYEELMRQYAPGLGAGIFLERAVLRKATELTEARMQDSEAGQETIRAAR